MLKNKYDVFQHDQKSAHPCFSKSHICRLFKEPGFPKGRKITPEAAMFVLLAPGLPMPGEASHETLAAQQHLLCSVLRRMREVQTCPYDRMTSGSMFGFSLENQHVVT